MLTLLLREHKKLVERLKKSACGGWLFDYGDGMPELPEVETVKNALEPALVGQLFERVIFNRKNLRFNLPKDLPKKLEGQKISSIFRRGKYIIVLAKNGHGFVLHLGMSGVIRIETLNSDHENLKHDHVEIFLKNKTRIVFNDPRRFGFFDAVTEQSWRDYPSLKFMGPEPLGNDFNAPVLKAKLKARKTPIKQALLDQKIVAGLGNIYVCEALYGAGISPRKQAGRLTVRECEKLVHEIGIVLRKAIKAGGSTLKDYRHTDGALGYFQHEFSVYDQEGEPCPDCVCDIIKTKGVKRIVQSGRSTFYCSTLQR